jgi:hypothetical protein
MHPDYINSGMATKQYDGFMPPDTFFGPLAAAHENIGMVAEQLEHLADRLCGAIPTTAANTKVGVVSRDGIFGNIEDRGRDMQAKTDRAFSALQRINAQLP